MKKVNFQRSPERTSGAGAAVSIDLSKYDIILCIDKSAQMNEPITKGKEPRWSTVEESTKAFVNRGIKFNKNGITLSLFGDTIVEYPQVNDDQGIERIFTRNTPEGKPDVQRLLEYHFGQYFTSRNRGETRPVHLNVVIGSEVQNYSEIKRVIVENSKKLKSEDEFRITFFQVGDTKTVTKFLDNLNDELRKGETKYDIFDVYTYSDLRTLSENLINSLND